MPCLLALDCSTEACSVALVNGAAVVERYVEAPREHMTRLLPMVDAVLAEAGLTLSALDAIAFGCGPGSFTGLRICLGVVQGLAFGAGLPVVPVSTLAALAQTGAGSAAPGTRLLSAIDARMDEVYWGWFELAGDGLVRAVGSEQLTPPERVAARHQGPLPAWGVGSGWHYRERFDCAGIDTVDAALLPRAAAVAALARPLWLQGRAVAAAAALPVYLRDDVVQAER